MLVRYQYLNSGDSTHVSINSDATDYAQCFTPSTLHTVKSIKIKIFKDVGATGTLNVSIRATTSSKPTGDDLASGTLDIDADISDTSAPGDWYTIDLGDGVALTASTMYALVVGTTDLAGSGPWVSWREGSGYVSGASYSGSGETWSVNGSYDMMFEEWGDYTSSSSPRLEVNYSRKLVAFAANELWYESSEGTMAELTAANDDIDTTSLLTAVEAFGKIFIANGTNKKVADFVNTKIVTTDIGSHPPDFGTILTGGTSGAVMTVDYITSTTADAACTIYGRRTTTATFSSGETVTGTDDDGNSISFATSAAETAPPHWYDWTVFGNDSTFGTISTEAYLCCLYRGRVVLAGDANAPHQWNMSKIANPWNWNYDSTNPLTAVAGQDADAGKIGDIITALVPYSDDFLVFGCANSIYVLDGDPAMGGSIDRLSEGTGILGHTAWCKDNNGNLYFFGSGGLYRMSGGRSKPENISYGTLPELVDDWAVDADTHRIVLSFDPFREGIIISKTTIADGTNLNYWYDLKLEGFFPETYPTECAIFSSLSYDADSSGTRGLLLGCNDGYIRDFVNTAKDDDVGDSDDAISSYATLPAILLGVKENADAEGKLHSLTIELAGGASSGSYSDTDSVSYELHIGDDAETVMEDILDGATAFTSGTLTSKGRQTRIRGKVRGRWLGIKLYNSTASQTWAVNLISGEIVPAGKIK